MGTCCKFGSLVILALSAWIGYNVYKNLYYVAPLPDLPLDRYWGPGEVPKTLDKSITSFKVEFKPEMLTNLISKLKSDDFYTEPLEGVGFQYGFNNKYLKDVISFWRSSYNFAEREAYLNQYPQFKTNIQGLDIHYLHVKPKVDASKKVFPLLLLHGWPGSVREFYDVIPLFTKPRTGHDYVFELIIPSLPGFGFSQGASKTGLGPAQIAVIMRNLMERLGYDKYLIHGGDWGSIITSHMATMYPERVLGYHTTAAGSMSSMSFLKLFLGAIYPPFVVEKRHEHKIYPLYNTFDFMIVEGGYMHIQATKPDTVGVGLKTSPIGLAAYILEKFAGWTNPNYITQPNGGLDNKFNFTNLLDNIMIYWASGSITTSMRIYSEFFSKAEMSLELDYIPIKVPTAVARFEYEVMFQTEWQLQDKYPNIVQISDFPTGGHFAAFEEPKMFADDIWKAVPKFFVTKKKTEL